MLRGALLETWWQFTPVMAHLSASSSEPLLRGRGGGIELASRGCCRRTSSGSERTCVSSVTSPNSDDQRSMCCTPGRCLGELREVEHGDLAVLLPPGVAFLLELLSPPTLLLGHPPARRELPLLEEVADRPAVRGEAPSASPRANRERPRPRSGAAGPEVTAATCRGRPARGLQEPSPARARHVDADGSLRRRRPSAGPRGSSARAVVGVLLALHLERDPARGSRPCAGSRRSAGSRGRACTTCRRRSRSSPGR